MASCSSDSPVTPGGGVLLYNISGSADGDTADGYILKGIVNNAVLFEEYGSFVGSAFIGAGNTFSINVGAPPDSNLHYIKSGGYSWFFGARRDSLTISDTNARISNALQLRYYDNRDTLIGRIFNGNYATHSKLGEGFKTVLFMYSTQSTTITGDYITVALSDTFRQVINLNLIEGWNPITMTREVIRPPYYETSLRSGIDPSCTWRASDLP